MKELTTHDRRAFLRRGAMGAGALWTLSLSELMSRRAYGSPVVPSPVRPAQPEAGPDHGPAPAAAARRLSHLSYSWTGEPAVGWHAMPESARRHGRGRPTGRLRPLILVRNHETAGGTPFCEQRRRSRSPVTEAGGTTNLIFNAKTGLWEKAWSTLAGTIRNCAGGVTPWGSWITCEETVDAGHGWNFDVGAQTGDPKAALRHGPVLPRGPHGRPGHRYVYETEDSGNCGFFKFVPFTLEARRGR